MRFDDDDEKAAAATRDELVDQFASWLLRHPEFGDAVATDADLMLDWKWGYGDRDFGRWQRSDIDELLLRHLPRKLSAPVEEIHSIPVSCGAFVAFLADNDLLDRRSDRPDELLQRARAQSRSFVDAMADPDNFGMAKRLFAHAVLSEDDVLDQAALDAALERFNALPFEERGRILGIDDRREDRYDDDLGLPPLPLRAVPDAATLDAHALQSPLLASVDRLHGAIGERGIKLTKAGNLVLAEAKRLVAEAGTGDRVDRIRSSADLPHLFAIGEIAHGAGAITFDTSRMHARPEWAQRSPRDRGRAVADAVVHVGAASLNRGAYVPPAASLTDLADGLACTLLGMLWLADEPVEIEAFVDMLTEVATAERAVPGWMTDDLLSETAARRVGELFDSLAQAGMVEKDGRAVTLPDASAWFVAPILSAAGWSVLVPDELAGLPARELLDRMCEHDADAETLGTLWAADLDRAPLAAGLVHELLRDPDPTRVVHGFAVLGHLGPDALPAIEAARATVLAPHALLALLDAGVVGRDEVPMTAVASAGIDLFAAAAATGSPADVIELLLSDAIDGGPFELVDVFVAGDHPRTATVLELIGRHHPEKAVAKYARKGAHRWRSAHGGRA